MKLDILAIAAHPDDVELSCSGTLLRHIDQGYSVGLVDLTQGELGTRGSAELRRREAEEARKLMGAEVRVNLEMPDGFFTHSRENLVKLAAVIRSYRPTIVLANALEDRHPDHGKGAKLISDACFIAGLRKVETLDEAGNPQDRWRPKAIYHFIQDYNLEPDLVVDISPYIERKMELVMAFKSQFYDPDSPEPSSPISSKEFLDFLQAKARVYGRPAGVEFGEGFQVQRVIGVNNLVELL
jgi:bacillithiol biosynthesis deacetylase BshB1